MVGSNWNFTSNGGLATNAPFGRIKSIVLDGVGNIYASDFDNNIVIKISVNGIVTIVAGNGLCSFSGDGGLATSAAICNPGTLALDSSGNLYVSDVTYRVRKVTPGGTISTVAGNGQGFGYAEGVPATSTSLGGHVAGLALDSAGNLYIANEQDRVFKVNSAGIISTVAGVAGALGYSGDAGPATSAKLWFPRGLAFDAAGNLYIADEFNNRIRRVTPAGIITTVAGVGTPGNSGDNGLATSAFLSEPVGVAFDTAGNLYIADLLSGGIRKVDASGIITRVAGTGVFASQGFSGDGGPALLATFSGPQDLKADALGNLLIADTGNSRIRKVDTAGTVFTYAGNGQFKFAGDGGQASSASLSSPGSVAVDPSGNLYIADNGNLRIRKVSPQGVIATVAGNGTTGFSADGILATNASLFLRGEVKADASGSVYFADVSSGRIRKISPSGIISTVAGNGNIGFSGDGGRATQASLYASGLALDATGNLYIADTGNSRIRKVDTSGIITTIAGTGLSGFAGDGGPATGAQLSSPSYVQVDPSGNVYFADLAASGARVRKIDTKGIISTIAGGGTDFSPPGEGVPAVGATIYPLGIALDGAGNVYIADGISNKVRKADAAGALSTMAGNGVSGFTGDGGLAPTAQLSGPSSVATDAAGNLYISDTGNDRIRLVRVDVPSYSATPASISTTASVGSLASGTIDLTSKQYGLAWTATTQTTTGKGWLTINLNSGVMPSSVAVSLDATNLVPGTYQGAVVITAPAASPAINTVAVTLVVTASATPPTLSVQPLSLTFQSTALSSNAPPPQTLRISNAGGGKMNWTASVQTNSGGNWVGTGVTSGSATPNSPSTLAINVNPTGLGAGSYNGIITVNSDTGKSQLVPVYLILSAPPQTLLVSQTGLTFTGLAGGGRLPPQQFGVINLGTAAMSWTAQVVTANCAWLSVSPASGSSTGGSTSPPRVTVSATSSGLPAGQSACQILVSAPGATNPTRLVTVIQNVLPAGSLLPPVVEPTGLIFVRQAGTSSPGSATVTLSTGAPAGVRASIATASLFSDPQFLLTAQSNLAVTPSQPATVIVQPNLSPLSVGAHYGIVTLGLIDTASGGFSSQNVNVLFVVTPALASRVADLSKSPAASGCSPSQLFLKTSSLGTNFNSAVGLPVKLEVLVKDDCDNAVTNATVLASFNTGDPILTLVHIGSGVYEVSWRPTSSATPTITFTATAVGLQPAQDTLRVTSSGSPVAAIAPGGVVQAASFSKGAGLAPGGIVSIFGGAMASDNQGQNASTTPLPTSLEGTAVNIGGIDAPLYFASNGQINAQLPSLSPGLVQAYLRVNRNGQAFFTDSETLTVIPAAPGIFTLDSSGTGQGAILIANTPLLAAPSGPGMQPVSRGQFVTIYCTGLGAVTNQPSLGVATPANPLSNAVIQPSVTIGGAAATVGFAGLAPGFVGLYQVNAQVPSSIAPGSAIPVVITQNGLSSNTATIAVQ